METKKIFFLFCILLSMSIIKALAYDIAAENANGVTIYYSYINNGKELEVTGCSPYVEIVVIPEDVIYMNRTRKVSRIGTKGFENYHRLTSITIPNSVTDIGVAAFLGCISLKSITIPNSMTSIGMSTFCGCI